MTKENNVDKIYFMSFLFDVNIILFFSLIFINMTKNLIIEKIIGKLKNKLISERKSDELSLKLSRLVIIQFKKDEDFVIEGLEFERGDDYANFDMSCTFIKNDNFNHPFSIDASSDIQSLDLEITYRPDDFPKHMSDLVGEVKETIEHELEHIEQQNFEDMSVIYSYDANDGEDNFKYLTSNEEIPAYVRGLIKRSKTKKISLSDAMDEWFEENQMKFDNPDEEWPIVKKIWMGHANDMRLKEKVKKFK
jgi:hypothetical protein